MKSRFIATTFAIAFLQLLSGIVFSQGWVQMHQPTIHPIYQHQGPNYSHIPIVTPPATLCDCGCGSTGICQDNPDCDYQVFRSPGSSHRKVIKTFNIPNPSSNDCIDGGEVTIPFYRKDVPTNGTVDVPAVTKRCVESYRFEQRNYDICGCKIKVCVPCEVVCDESKQCEPVPMEVPILIRVRREPVGGILVADVWANDVKGLPKTAVLGTKMTATEINNKFKTNVTF